MPRKNDALRFLLGMAFYWPFFIHQLYTPEIFADTNTHGPSLHHAIVLSTMIVCLTAGCLARRKTSRSTMSRPSLSDRASMVCFVICPTLLCASALIVFFTAGASPWFSILCPISQGIGITAATLGWAKQAATFDKGLCAVILGCSMTLSQIINAAALSLGSALNVPDFLWCVAFPLVSCLLLFPNARAENTASSRTTASRQVAPSADDARSTRSWLIMLGVLALYLLGTGIFRSNTIAQTGTLSPVFDFTQRLVVLAMSLALVIYAEFERRHEKEPYPWVLFGFACLAILYFVVIGRQYFPTVCSVIVLHSRLIAVFLMWAAAERYVRVSSKSPLMLAAIFLIPQTIVRGVSSAPWTVWDTPWSSTLLEASLIATAFLMTVGVFWWVRLRTSEQAATAPTQKHEMGRAVLNNAQAAYGLTDRERDVLELLARGYTQKSIADELGLSLNSVRTYAKTLYLKLGVHSRQEVIELMNQKLGDKSN